MQNAGASVHNPLFLRQKGFTLIELMVTLSVLFVLAVVAIPNLGGFLLRSQHQQVVGDLVSSMAFARSEAIKRGVPVTMAAVSSGSQRLQEGWRIFLDPERTATFDSATGSATVLLQQQDPYPAGEVLIGHVGSNALTANSVEYVHFDALGRSTTITGADGANSLTAIVVRYGDEKFKTALCIGWAGRVRLVSGKANNDTGGCG
jgi:prepilin-type N-terminal cleavage/methylation domain-containing protein